MNHLRSLKQVSSTGTGALNHAPTGTSAKAIDENAAHAGLGSDAATANATAASTCVVDNS